MNRSASYPSSDDVDIAALWRAVAAKKRLLAGLVLSAGLLTFILLQFVTPLYTSQARILVEHDETAFLRTRTDSGNSYIRVRLDPEAVASQAQVLMSRDLARQVVKDLKLEGNPEFNKPFGLSAAITRVLVAVGLSRAPTVAAREEWALDAFERRLTVYQVEKSRVIAVDFDSRDPKTAADAANKLAEVYLAWQQKAKLDQTRDASQWLNEQIKTLRGEVARSESEVEKYRSSSGLIAGSNNVTLDAQQMSEVNSQLILAGAQRSEAEARADLIRRMLKEKGDVESAPDVLRSPLIQRLLEQQVRVRRELAELSATLLPSHPRIRQLNSELSDLKRQIRREAGKVVSSLENEAQIAGAREASLRASLNDLKKRSSASREDEIKLRSLEREAKANRDLLESYLARYSEASAQRDGSSVPASATIISRAHVEREPSFPKKGPISILVAAAVGLLSLAMIVARELIAGTAVASPARLAASRSAPAGDPAPVKAVPSAAPAGTGQVLHARSARAAAKIVAAKCSGSDAQSVVVAPGNHHANTAQDALDVARAMAASGLRVAIVDFSTNGPGIGGLVGISNVPGLGELLAGSANFEDVVSADREGSVQIIPPGALPMDPFAGDGMTQWIRVYNALRQIYDCIVLHMSLSSARRLVGDMQGDLATVLLVTGRRGDAALAEQVAQHLSGGDASLIDVVTYSGARTARGSAGPMPAFGRRTAAAV